MSERRHRRPRSRAPTLYREFLDRHQARFRGNRRMRMQLVNLARKDEGEVREIRREAEGLRRRLG